LAVKYESRIASSEYANPLFMGDIEYSGKDWNGQLKYGTAGFMGANYMQAISPHLSAGGEVFYLSQQKRSGTGLAVRLADDKSVGTLQVSPRRTLRICSRRLLRNRIPQPRTGCVLSGLG
jgi:mitochondrial import receptor subunit TOM40